MTSFDVNNIAVLNVNGNDEIDFRYIVASSLELVKKKPCIYIYIYIYNIYRKASYRTTAIRVRNCTAKIELELDQSIGDLFPDDSRHIRTPLE